MSTTKKERDEDSGLHDIRSLASSTKARISSRRSTQNPIVTEDDILASSSAGWKAVALPEPARMVSLPELASLPNKAEIESADRAAREKLKAELKAEKAERKAAAAAVPTLAGATATATDAPVPMTELPDVPSIGARIAAKQSSGKGLKIALAGVGLAAAAGAAIFFAMSGDKKTETVAAAAESRPLPKAPEMTAKQLPPPPAPAAESELATGAAAAPEPAVAAVEPPPAAETKAPAKADRGKDTKDKVHKVEIRDTVNTEVKNEKPAPVAVKEEPKKGGGDEEPSFDALLKEAGVSDAKKEAKPKLDKKSLSGADIKAGMSSVAGKAQACYAGTQGTAAVKLTVDPSGQVQKVTVTGQFAGTPVANCVEKAVKSATFPPWDGGPQSIAYSYLLAE